MRHVRSKALCFGALCTMSALAFTASNVVLAETPATVQTDVQTTNFNIPAQPLGEALADYAEQADVLILASADVTRGKRSAGISGLMTASAALDALLDGQGLRSDRRTGGAIAISSEQGGDSDPGNVRPQPTLMAQSQTSANQTKTKTERQTSETETGTDAPIQLEEIIVTGTNIRGVENHATPVISFDREDIELTGATTVEDFLRTVPQNFGSETQFSDNSQNPTKSRLNTAGGTGVDLRGAGIGSTLVLLNGRRLPPSDFGAFVDVSVLPLSVIDRIDIQTDGASAVYGSDAVAGVVNFITSKHYEGIDAFARYGTVTNGSLREQQAGLTAGRNWASGGGLVSFEYTDKNPLFASERDYIEVTTVNPNGSLSSDEQRYSAALSLHQGITDRLILSADVLHSNRDALRAQNTGRQFTIKTTQSNWYGTTRLDYTISDQLNAGLYVDYGETYLTSRADDDDFEEESQRANQLLVVEGKTSGSVLDVWGGRLGFALGLLYRKEEYEAGRDGTVSQVAQREVKSAYGELLIPIVGEKNAFQGVQAFDISLAGRYEEYDDFGDNFAPKIGLHWRINDSFALRGTYSESYRAPLLIQLNGPIQIVGLVRPVSQLTVVPTPPQDPRLDDGFFSYVFTAGANPDLVPESADVWTSGFEFQPESLEGLNVEGTYFHIDYADRIERLNPFEVVGNPAYLSFLELNPDTETLSGLVASAEFLTNFLPFELTDDNIQVLGYTGFRNVSKRLIKGVDLSVSYDWTTTKGDFTASVDGTYLLDYEAQITDVSAPQEQVSTVYRPVDLKLRSALSWSFEGFSVYAAVNYVDGYTDNLSGVSDNAIEKWTTMDLMLAYDSGDRIASPWLSNSKISLGVQNLFDRDPPFVDTADGLNFDSTNATPLGRFVTLRINKSF